MDIKKRLNKQNIMRGISYLKRNGLKEAYYKAKERLIRDDDEKDYSEKVINNIITREEAELQRKRDFIHKYKISVIVPAYETEERYIRDMLSSVTEQTYSNWELCIADGSSTDKVKTAVEEFCRSCPEETAVKIKYKKLNRNLGISGNTNEALKMATGEYIGLLDHDDILTSDALYQVMCVLEAGLYEIDKKYINRIKCIYSDEDKVNNDLNRYFDYHKKPDFDIDLLRTNNYICHFFVVRSELAKKVGFNDKYNGAQDHDFIFRCVENLENNEIYHIEKVLYHWRSSDGSTAENPDSKLYAYEAGKYAIEDHLNRMGIKAEVVNTKHLGFYRVKYNVTKENILEDILCMGKTQWDMATYDEIKGSGHKYIMVMSDDIKPVTSDYLEELSSNLIRAEVGCVGGKIIDRHGKIESAGYRRDEMGQMIPLFRGLDKNYSGYLHRASLQQKVDGVSLDCMMIKVEALDTDKNLSEKYMVIYDPYAEFVRK